jgi:hypothetical protein
MLMVDHFNFLSPNSGLPGRKLMSVVFGVSKQRKVVTKEATVRCYGRLLLRQGFLERLLYSCLPCYMYLQAVDVYDWG